MHNFSLFKWLYELLFLIKKTFLCLLIESIILYNYLLITFITFLMEIIKSFYKISHF